MSLLVVWPSARRCRHREEAKPKIRGTTPPQSRRGDGTAERNFVGRNGCGTSHLCPPLSAWDKDRPLGPLDHLVTVVMRKVPRGRYHRTLRHLIHNWETKCIKIVSYYADTHKDPTHTDLLHAFTTMPREPSDARAALMAVYLSRRLSLVTPSNMPAAAKKLKSAERPSHRMKHAKELARTHKVTKNVENIPHRRRRDVNERTHTIRASGAGLVTGLGCTGRTIYGVGEASGGVIRRQRRRNMGKPGEPISLLPPARIPAIKKIGEGEMREVQTRKKEDDMCSSGHMKQTGDDRLLGDVGEEHADAFFEMYINAEAWGG